MRIRVVVFFLLLGPVLVPYLPNTAYASTTPVLVAQATPEVQELLDSVSNGERLVVMPGAGTDVEAIRSELQNANVDWAFVFLVDFGDAYPQRKAQLSIALDSSSAFRAAQDEEGRVMSIAIIIDPNTGNADILAGAGLEERGFTSAQFYSLLEEEFKRTNSLAGAIAGVIRKAKGLPEEYAQQQASLRAQQEALAQRQLVLEQERLARQERIRVVVVWSIAVIIILAIFGRLMMTRIALHGLKKRLMIALDNALRSELGLEQKLSDLVLQGDILTIGLSQDTDQARESQQVIELAKQCIVAARGAREIIEILVERANRFDFVDLWRGHVYRSIVIAFERGEETFILTLEVNNSGETPRLDQFMHTFSLLDGSAEGDGVTYPSLVAQLKGTFAELEAASASFLEKQAEAGVRVQTARERFSQTDFSQLWTADAQAGPFILTSAQTVTNQLQALVEEAELKLNGGDKSGAFNTATLAEWVIQRLTEIQGYIREGRTDVLPSLAEVQHYFESTGTPFAWAHTGAQQLVDSLGTIISRYPVASQPDRARLEQQTEEWANSLRAFKTELDKAVQLERARIAASETIQELQRTIAAERIALEQELVATLAATSMGLRLGEIIVLSEQGSNPDQDVQAGSRHRDAIQSLLGEGQVSRAGEAEQSMRESFSLVQVRIDRTRETIAGFGARLNQARNARENVAAQVGGVRAVLTDLSASYSDGAIASATTQLGVDGTLQSTVNAAAVVLSEITNTLEAAQRSFQSAQVLAAQASVDVAIQQTSSAESDLEKVAEAKRMLDQTLADVERTLQVLAPRVRAAATACQETFVREKAESFHREAASAMLQANSELSSPCDPFKAQQALRNAQTAISQCEQSVETDRQAHSSATTAISGAETAKQSARSAIASAQNQDSRIKHGTVELGTAESHLREAETRLDSAKSHLARKEFEEAKSAAGASSQASERAKSAASQAVEDAEEEHDRYVADHTPAPVSSHFETTDRSSGGNVGDERDRSSGGNLFS